MKTRQQSHATAESGVTDIKRRRFLQRGVCASGLVLLGWQAVPALAQQKPMLDPESYPARALDYVQNAEEASDHEAYRTGKRCDNCEFFTAETQVCGLFPDHRVASQGWCSSWTSSDS
ncbi:high-potential iron-sulfur protein [Salinicola halophyticus]|uniref:high-potential iron-sulfur protein n=1 Tax=Salinicola halophyticus TaxID=1808881 RepID=UPI000DA257A6|nr:high-potential iron-sulfur protein [Salinicola halophyticus]